MPLSHMTSLSYHPCFWTFGVKICRLWSRVLKHWNDHWNLKVTLWVFGIIVGKFWSASHGSDITWLSEQFKLLFVQLPVQAYIKENIKALQHCPLPEKFCSDQWFPSQRASNAERISLSWCHHDLCSINRIIFGMGSANERWRHNVTSSIIGWAHT